MNSKTTRPVLPLVILIVCLSFASNSRATSVSSHVLIEGELSECLNGGVMFDGQCLCPESYTGTKCETFMFLKFNPEKAKEDTQYHFERFRRSVSETSGSGASGSGGEEVEEVVCSQHKQISIDGVCKVPTSINGKTNLENEEFDDLYLDRRNNKYKMLQRTIQYRLDLTFGDIPEFVQSQVKGFRKNDGGGTDVYYVLYFAPLSDEEINNLMNNISKAGGAENTVQVGGFVEFNECESYNDCDVNANCISKVGDYQCTCGAGFVDISDDGNRAGSNCRKICFTEDGGDYCENGDCNAFDDGEYCTCNIGYSGTQCKTYWFAWEISTIILAVVLGVLLVVLLVSAIMMCVRRSWKKCDEKSDAVELNSTNGKGKQGVVNPYHVEDENGTDGQNDKLTPQDEDDEL